MTGVSTNAALSTQMVDEIVPPCVLGHFKIARIGKLPEPPSVNQRQQVDGIFPIVRDATGRQRIHLEVDGSITILDYQCAAAVAIKLDCLKMRLID